MKKAVVGILLLVFGYGALYWFGRPFALRNEPPIRRWAPIFYPMRLLEAQMAGVVTAKGTIQQSTDGRWSLTYATPKTDPGGVSIQGIAFRVPMHLARKVAEAKGKLVEVTIGKEPDSEHLGVMNFVLTSLTLSTAN